MSSKEPLLLSLRGSWALRFCHAPPQEGDFKGFERIEASVRDMSFSKDGSLFAWCTNERIEVSLCANYDVILKEEKSRLSSLDFSPKGTYISAWEMYTAKSSQQESCNLHIWNVKTGEYLKSFIHKKQTNWKPQWSDDEHLCARNVNNEVHFFEDAKFDNIAKKLYLQKVVHFSLAPGAPPYHVACFVPGVKGQPSFVRLFQYPKFEGSSAVIAQKSFFKAEYVNFLWNKTGKDCLVLTAVDVDKSGSSYYGEQNLYYLSLKGETAKVTLKKDGPIYSVNWNPNSSEFCVVYGYMPAKATIFSLKCEPLFDFGSGPRNEIHYSLLGDRLILCGFGNLQGNVEVWDLKDKKQISKFTATDSTYIEWCPDGQYLLTASTSPRLKIGNGYRVWHYTGSLLQEIFFHPDEQLFDIKWKPVPDGVFKKTQTVFAPVQGIKSAKPEASKQVYRPPAAQGRPASFKLHDDEPPSSASQNDNAKVTKNMKKKMARKAKKELEKSEQNDSVEISDNVSPPVRAKSNPDQWCLTGDPEKDKRIRALLKKLDQIEKLKKEKEAGKKMELTQLEKIKKQSDIEEELENLQIS